MLFISGTKLHPNAGSIYNHKLANCTIFTDFSHNGAMWTNDTMHDIQSPKRQVPAFCPILIFYCQTIHFSYKFLIFTEIQNPKNNTP